MIIEILEFYTGDNISAMSLVKTSFWFEYYFRGVEKIAKSKPCVGYFKHQAAKPTEFALNTKLTQVNCSNSVLSFLLDFKTQEVHSFHIRYTVMHGCSTLIGRRLKWLLFPGGRLPYETEGDARRKF